MQESVRSERFQVFGGRESGHLQAVLDELDLGVRVGKQVVNRVLAFECKQA